MLANAQHLPQHLSRFFHRLQRAREDDEIKRRIRIEGQVIIRIAVNHREPRRHRPGGLGHVDLNAPRIGALGQRQIFQQRAIATADIEHAGTGGDHLGDQPQINPHVFCNVLNSGVRHHTPKALAAPATNPPSAA